MAQPPRRRTSGAGGAGYRAAKTVAYRDAKNLAATVRTECDAIDAATDDPAIRAAVARIREALNRTKPATKE
ncbi:hypothetical protein [Streptomyces sp. NPDC088258]|uniref:hypothetical protein n=1 Tax=Streptomyces sp. NPDC088258 TaxID=3365849 RepID=UPI00382F2CDA